MGLLIRTVLVAAGVAVAATSPTAASDHFDQPGLGAGLAADIGDVYAFPSPNRPGNLVVMVTAHAAALSKTRFDDAVDYELRVRPVKEVSAAGTTFDNSIELRVSCRYDWATDSMGCAARSGSPQQLAAGEWDRELETTVGFNETSGDADSPFQLFAGIRSEPFFLDSLGALKTLTKKELNYSGLAAGLYGTNTMAIVVELDLAEAMGEEYADAMVAVAAEVVRIGEGS